MPSELRLTSQQTDCRVGFTRLVPAGGFSGSTISHHKKQMTQDLKQATPSARSFTIISQPHRGRYE